MALITCPDCSTEISDQANACPKCGRPTEKAKAEEDRQIQKAHDERERREKERSPLLVPSFIVFGLGMVMYMTGVLDVFGLFGGVFAMIAGVIMFLYAIFVGAKK